MRHLIECGLLSALLTGWLLLPSLVESGYLNLSTRSALADLRHGDFSRWAAWVLEMFTPIVERPKFRAGYLGWVLPALAVSALVSTRLGTRGSMPRYPAALVLLGLPWPAFGQLRSDILIFLGVVVLAGDGFHALAQRARAHHAALRLASVLMLMDVGEGLVKDEYARHDAKPYLAAAEAMQQSGVPGRVLRLSRGKSTFWAGMDTVFSDLSTPLGAVPQLATQSIGSTLAITAQLARELLDERQTIGPRSAALMRLLGVRYVLLGRRHERLEGPRFPPVLFAARAQRVAWDPVLAEVDINAASALAERAIPGDTVLSWAEAMQLDPATPRARTVLVTDDALGALDTSPADGAFEVTGFQERQRAVTLAYRAERAGYVRLAYAYVPFGQVTIDDEPVSFARDAFGTVVARVPAGVHRVSYRVGMSALRCWLLSLATLTLAVVALRLLRARRGADPSR